MDFVELVVGGERISCPKDVLIHHSDYFRAMFSSNMKEASAGQIDIHPNDLEAFKIIINFMTTSKLEIDSNNVYKVTEAACMFQTPDIIQQCKDFILNLVNTEDCIDNYIFAETFNIPQISNQCRNLIRWDFNTIAQSTAFIELDEKHVTEFITDPYLNISGESDVIAAVQQWSLHTSSPVDLPAVLVHSGYCDYLSLKDIDAVSDSKLFINHQNIYSQLKEICSQEDRKIRNRMPYQLVLYGVSKADTTRGGLWLCDAACRPTDCNPIIDLPPELCEGVNWSQNLGYRLCLHDCRLFVSGGVRNMYKQSWNYDVWCYNFLLNRWSLLTTLRNPRRHHGVCAVGKKIFLIGGIGKYRMKSYTVESYDYEIDEWRTCASLPADVYPPFVYQKDDQIIVHGNGTPCYIYNISADVWRIVTKEEIKDFNINRDKGSNSQSLNAQHQVYNNGFIYEAKYQTIYRYSPESQEADYNVDLESETHIFLALTNIPYFT